MRCLIVHSLHNTSWYAYVVLSPYEEKDYLGSDRLDDGLASACEVIGLFHHHDAFAPSSNPDL
jgi:hypothetical protein